MDLITTIKGLNVVGWGNVFKALQFGFRKKRIEAKALKQTSDELKQLHSIGEFKKSEKLKNGLKLEFTDAELELVVLADNLVRVTWTPGTLPAPYFIEKNDWPEISVEQKEEDGWQLFTDKIKLHVNSNGGIQFCDEDSVLREELPPTRAGKGWRHEAKLKEEEHFYGLGQRNHDLNLNGGSYLMWNEEPMGDFKEGSDPIYVCIPTYIGLNKNGSYLVFYENSHKGTVEFKETAKVHFYRGALRYYFVMGPADKALDRYSELVGRPFMPPEWALGYHQTRWSYKSETETREVADGFEKHNLPISAIHLDIHYMDGYRVFTVDEKRFPDLKRLSSDLSDKGIKTVTILDPGVKSDKEFALYNEGIEQNLFCKMPDGSVIEGPVWPGWCGFPDFTKAATRDWWGKKYAKLLELGVDGFWHDMNEPAVFSGTGHPTLPENTLHDMEGKGGDHLEAHNLYGYLENRAAFEGLRKLAPEKRPWLLTRSGCAGIQRYAFNWTGDTGCNWWSMKHNLKLGLMLGLSGVPYTGSDTGGFNGNPSAELYIRWFEMSSFMPFFRTHSAAFVKRREPWSFGDEITDIARKYLELRYALMPYWYTLAHEASVKGWPLMRPLWWCDNNDRRLWDVEDQFMLGDSILVAPVMEKGALSRKVILPEGKWYSLWNKKWHEGYSEIQVEADLGCLPLFIKDASMVPMKVENRLCLHVYLSNDAKNSGAKIYSDKGDGYKAYRIDSFELSRNDDGFEIERSSEGEFEFSYGGFEVEIHGLDVKQAFADDKLIEKNETYKTGMFKKLKLII